MTEDNLEKEIKHILKWEGMCLPWCTKQLICLILQTSLYGNLEESPPVSFLPFLNWRWYLTSCITWLCSIVGHIPRRDGLPAFSKILGHKFWNSSSSICQWCLGGFCSGFPEALIHNSFMITHSFFTVTHFPQTQLYTLGRWSISEPSCIITPPILFSWK